MRLDIQRFGGRGASSSETKKERLNKSRSNFNNITTRIIKMYNSNQDTQSIKRDLKIEIWSNRKETKEDENTTRVERTNTATIYSYANAKNKNDYANMKVVGIIEEKNGKWRQVKNATSRIKTSGRETYSVIDK